MRTMINKQSVLFCLLVVMCISAGAQQCERKSLLTVSGTGEVRVVPDQVSFIVEVQNFDKDRAKAKTDNSGRVRNVLEVIRSFKVDEKSLQTHQQSIGARYKGGDESKALLGFNAVTRIRVKLLDLKVMDDLQEKVLANGATEISEIEFEIADRSQHRAKARAMAIAAAKEKARVMAEELGQKIGRAFSMTEGQSTTWMYAQMGLTRQSNDFAVQGYNSSTLAEGTIQIQESVQIEFELQ
jgi:hypothetical protein